MTEEQMLYNTISKKVENAEQGQMFGKPCLKIKGKAFVCFFQDEMVFKLEGEMHEKAVSLDGAKLFDPSGKNRPMKEWVQVPFNYSDNWIEFAYSAKEYVFSKLK